MVNILSGGWHAGHNIEIQDVLVIAHGFELYRESLRAVVSVHTAAKRLLQEKGYNLTGVADEGGWGPMLPSNESALEIVTQAIERAGYRPAGQMFLALDVAASHFHHDGRYELGTERQTYTSEEFIDLLERWTRTYPVASVEDGLDQDDWVGWQRLTKRLGSKVQLVGDDFLVTNPVRVRKAIQEKCANAVLIKMNQIGTLKETFDVLQAARSGGYGAVVSARSGETEDPFLADLAVASGAGQIKVGSITRSERLAKYNRLLEIEAAEKLEYAKITFGAG
jgi:enolase